MANLPDIINYIETWIHRANDVRDSLYKLSMQYPRATELQKVELKQKFNRLMLRQQLLREEVNPLINRIYRDLKTLPLDDLNVEAGKNIINAGKLLLVTNPDLAYLDRVMPSFQRYIESLHRALKGQWDEPLTPIFYLKLDPSIKESLFFYNGIATAGQLLFVLRMGEDLFKVGGQRKKKCQNALLLLGYSITAGENSPLSWGKAEQICPGLWKVHSKDGISFFLKISDKQAEILKDYGKVNSLPDKSSGIRLALVEP